MSIIGGALFGTICGFMIKEGLKLRSRHSQKFKGAMILAIISLLIPGLLCFIFFPKFLMLYWVFFAIALLAALCVRPDR